MMSQQSCPDRSHLRALLNGTLPKDARRAISEHLETCGDCQQTVDRETSVRGLNIPPPRMLDAAMGAEEPTLRRVMDSLVADPKSRDAPRDADPGADAASFDFLEPPQQPQHLGRIGHYEISQVIGRGGMGVVFKALDEKLQRIVAIKVMAGQLAADELARKRFLREARAAAAIHEPHVVTIYAIEEFRGLPYLVMEHVAGESLQGRLDRSGPLDEREVLRIGRHVALGLAAAHAKGLIHRDIKPANILLDSGGRAKISDFGLARAVDDSSLSHLGVVAGTPQYMAPELARGERADHRADLFSLGSVLYAMCSGQAPFSGGNVLSILRRICDEAPRPIQEVNPSVPSWLAKLIDELQNKDPARRIQSAAEVAAVLAKRSAKQSAPAALREPPSAECGRVSPRPARGLGETPATVLPGRLSATRGRNRRKLPIMFLALSASLAVMAAGAVLVWSSGAARNTPSIPPADAPANRPAATPSHSTTPARGEAVADAPTRRAAATPSPVVTHAPRVLFVLPSRDIYAPDFVPVAAYLKQAGVKYMVASSTLTAVVPNLSGQGEPMRPGMRLDHVRAADFDAVVFCGGPAAIDEYTGDAPHAAAARRLINDMLAANKYIAALCTGPVILADAGVLRGVRATCFEYGDPKYVYVKRLKAAGAEWVNQPVVVSGSIITGRGPSDALEFARVLSQQLSQR